MTNPLSVVILVLIGAAIVGEIVYLIWKRKHRLHLAIFFHQKSINMASVNSITLTDLLKHTGLIVVVDALGNQYAGTLANLAVVVTDPTQDTIALDSSSPNTLDVTDLLPGGGTTATITGDFTSQGNATPTAGSTAQAIPDGTVFPGLKVLVTVINKIPSQVQLALQVNF